MRICAAAPYGTEELQTKLISCDLAAVVSLNRLKFWITHRPTWFINVILFSRCNDQNTFRDVLAAHVRSSAALAICGADVFLLKGFILRRILGKCRSHSLVERSRFRTVSKYERIESLLDNCADLMPKARTTKARKLDMRPASWASSKSQFDMRPPRIRRTENRTIASGRRVRN